VSKSSCKGTIGCNLRTGKENLWSQKDLTVADDNRNVAFDRIPRLQSVLKASCFDMKTDMKTEYTEKVLQTYLMQKKNLAC